MPIDTPMPTFKFFVTYAASAGDGFANFNASYMQQEDGLVLFKDHSHGVVFAVNDNALITVQREGLVQ